MMTKQGLVDQNIIIIIIIIINLLPLGLLGEQVRNPDLLQQTSK